MSASSLASSTPICVLDDSLYSDHAFQCNTQPQLRNVGRQVRIRAVAASPSKLETTGSESARAAAAVHSRAVALGTVGENCWLQHVQLVDHYNSTQVKTG